MAAAIFLGGTPLDTYHVVLFLHLLALFVGVGAASVLVVCLFHLRGATTLETALPWGIVAGKTERAFPVAILGLFATGAYMTSDIWTWSTGWIAVSIAGLAVMSLQGPLVGGRAGHQLAAALQANGPGPLGERAKAMTRHPGLWLAEFCNIGIVFGIVWNMTQKPGTGQAIAAIVCGYAVGVILATWLRKAGQAELPEAVSEPAA
jgi:hypothetical protein